MHTSIQNSAPATRKMLNAPVESPVGDQAIAKSMPSNDQKDPTIWFWVALFVVFILWGWMQDRHEKLRSQLEPQNMQANIHNLFIITFAAVIGVVGGKVLFTKLAAITSRMPFVGRAFGYLAKLFSAA